MDKGVGHSRILVSRAPGFEPGVSDRLGTVRCLAQTTLIHLAEAIRALSDIFRSQWRITSPQAREQASQIVTNRIPKATWFFDAYSSSKDFVAEDKLTSSWTKSP